MITEKMNHLIKAIEKRKKLSEDDFKKYNKNYNICLKIYNNDSHCELIKTIYNKDKECSTILYSISFFAQSYKSFINMDDVTSIIKDNIRDYYKNYNECISEKNLITEEMHKYFMYQAPTSDLYSDDYNY